MFNRGGGIRSGVIGLFCLLLTVSVHAAQLSDNLVVNGFFTLDASVSRGGDSAFPGSTSLVELKQDEINYDNSLLGLQADYAITSNLQLTLQGIAGKAPDDEYNASLEWAYLRYDLGNDLYLRAGQFHPAFLQGTELRYVGYSRIWARPLVPTNGTAGFETYQGVEFIKHTPIGDYNLFLQGGAGVAEHQQSNIENNDFELLSAKMEKDESWLKVGMFHARSDINRRDGPGVIVEDAISRGASIETEFLTGATQLNLGYVDVVNDEGPDEQMKYLSLGYHLGSLTPYLLYQYQSRTFAPPSGLPPPPPPGPLPPGPPPPAPVVGTTTSNSYSLGLRYDLGSHYAIKAQIERIDKRWVDGIESDTDVYTLILEGTF